MQLFERHVPVHDASHCKKCISKLPIKRLIIQLDSQSQTDADQLMLTIFMVFRFVLIGRMLEWKLRFMYFLSSVVICVLPLVTGVYWRYTPTWIILKCDYGRELAIKQNELWPLWQLMLFLEVERPGRRIHISLARHIRRKTLVIREQKSRNIYKFSRVVLVKWKISNELIYEEKKRVADH